MKFLVFIFLGLFTISSWAVSEETDFLGLYEFSDSSGQLNFSFDKTLVGKIEVSAKTENLYFQAELDINELKSLFFEESGTITDHIYAGSDRWDKLKLALVFGRLRTVVIANTLFESEKSIYPIHNRALTIYLRNGSIRGFSIAESKLVDEQWHDAEEGRQNSLILVKPGLELKRTLQSQELEIGRVNWSSTQLLLSENKPVTEEFLDIFCYNYCIK